MHRSSGRRGGRRGRTRQHVGLVLDGPRHFGSPRRRDGRGEERRRGRKQRRGSDAGEAQRQQFETEARSAAGPRVVKRH